MAGAQSTGGRDGQEQATRADSADERRLKKGERRLLHRPLSIIVCTDDEEEQGDNDDDDITDASNIFHCYFAALSSPTCVPVKAGGGPMRSRGSREVEKTEL